MVLVTAGVGKLFPRRRQRAVGEGPVVEARDYGVRTLPAGGVSVGELERVLALSEDAIRGAMDAVVGSGAGPALACEVLFARFAWTVFSPGVLRPFLDRCVTNRYLLVHDPETGEMTVETWSPEQSRAILDAAMPPCRGIPEQAPAVLAAAVQSACESPVGGEGGGRGGG